MVGVDVVALEDLEPKAGFHVVAPVFVPGNVELGFLFVAQDFGGHEGEDVEAHAVTDGRKDRKSNAALRSIFDSGRLCQFADFAHESIRVRQKLSVATSQRRL